MQCFGGETTFRRVTLLGGIISFMSVFGDIGLLNDIGKESLMGWDVSGEWTILYLSQILKAAYFLITFKFVAGGLRAMKHGLPVEKSVRDETVFYAIHYTGMFCGAIGLWLTFVKFQIGTSIQNLKYLVVYYNTFIIAPYCLIAFYWLFMKRREKIVEWYDEKQFMDISKAGLTTLIITLPSMGILYAADYLSPGGPASVLWFPFYLHLVLTFFSASVLYLKES